MRNVDTPRLGLKKLGMSARGLLADEGDEHDGVSVTSEEDVVVVPREGKGKRRGRESLSAAKTLGKDELTRQSKEIMRDKENIHVRRVRRFSYFWVCLLTRATEPDTQRNHGNFSQNRGVRRYTREVRARSAQNT
jgi:hypothetical protein